MDFAWHNMALSDTTAGTMMCNTNSSWLDLLKTTEKPLSVWRNEAR